MRSKRPRTLYGLFQNAPPEAQQALQTSKEARRREQRERFAADLAAARAREVKR